MADKLAQVYLNCLKCGAKLRITKEISEFACQFCGLSQIVERSGGIITLKNPSASINQVQRKVDETAVNSRIKTFTPELAKLEADYIRLENSFADKRAMVNITALILIVVFAVPLLMAAASIGSFIPLLICAIVEFIVMILWRLKINKIDKSFHHAAKPLTERRVEIEWNISKLRKMLED